ncbi:hypothetical protein H5T87_08810 [bacterium]|nr:hypothetical protein [bacterium]
MRFSLLFLVVFPLLAIDFGQECMSAFHETILSSFDNYALPGAFTYDHDPRYWLHNIAIGKWKIGLRLQGRTLWLYEGVRQETTQTPEELVISVQIREFKVRARLFPMMVGRDTSSWEGAIGLYIRSEPEADLVVQFGAPGRVRIHGFGSQLPFRWQYLQQPDLILSEPSWREIDGVYLTPIPETPLYVAVRSSSLKPSADGFWVIAESRGEMAMVVAFSQDAARACHLARKDVREEEKKLKEHYQNLFRSAWIRTPEPALNEAFRCALWNLEFTWVRPWGWIEAVHHWGTLYSQQHSLASDWLGQEDRSREMIMIHAKHILPNGMIPQLDTYGRARVDFGGWNQFYVWDVQHHWRMTADKGFAREIYPTLLKVVEGTFSLHDPEGNGLLGFGQQIGNQEDYISTPEDGTSPTIAGIEMLRTVGEIAEACGYKEEAKRAREKADWMKEQLKKELWQKELGWFAFYKDALGVLHIEPPYHSLIWPVIYDILDPLDSYTSLRHLKEALRGREGEIYVSNLFPSYVNATVGSQAGGQQQPWATLAFSRLGYTEDGLAPLLWISKLVVSSPHNGAWPELGIEPTRAYFSPPAGVFIQGVIEGLFGLTLDKPKGRLYIRPGIPLQWKEAELHLPKFSLWFFHEKGQLRLKLKSEEAFQRQLRWALPVWKIEEVRVNGKLVPFKIEPLVNRIMLIVDVPDMRESDFVIRYKEINWKLIAPSEVVEGGKLKVKLEGGKILGVEDRQMIVNGWRRISNGEIEAILRQDISGLGERFGEMGRKLFSHRTFFLFCRAESVDFWASADLKVLPKIEIKAKEETLPDSSYVLTLHLKNNSEEEINGKGELWLGIDESGKPVCQYVLFLNLKAKGEQIIVLPLSFKQGLYPGYNPLILKFPDGKIEKTEVRLSGIFGEVFSLSAEIFSIPLKKEMLHSDESWREFRWWSAYGHPPWNALRPPLEGIDGEEIIVPQLAGMRFPLHKRSLAVVSWHINQPRLALEVKSEARKLYLLVIPFLDHQDAYSLVGRIIAVCGDGAIFEKELNFPGDLDWWGPPSIIGDFATFGKGWAKSISVETTTSIMNVLELDLGKRRYVERIVLETNGRYPALGIVSVVGLK